MDLTPLLTLARETGCTVTENAPMAQVTTFRIGGMADALITIPDGDTVTKIIALCYRESIPYFWLGNGSNLLVGDRGIRGAVLRLDSRAAKIVRDGNALTADAGVTLQRLCRFARDESLTGLEFAYGIPGTLGGAVYMNGGAYGGEMAQVVTSVKAVTYTGKPVTFSAQQLALSYRHSALMDYPTGQAPIITAVTIALQPGEQETIASAMKKLIQKRQEKQPLEYPSAGSFFKRPIGHFAGALIEQAGLKGYRVGDAQISEKHAGFVINRGTATANDVRQLCADVQATVLEQFGVSLEPEVRFIGEF